MVFIALADVQVMSAEEVLFWVCYSVTGTCASCSQKFWWLKLTTFKSPTSSGMYQLSPKSDLQDPELFLIKSYR